jgi:hypothetical protein
MVWIVSIPGEYQIEVSSCPVSVILSSLGHAWVMTVTERNDRDWCGELLAFLLRGKMALGKCPFGGVPCTPETVTFTHPAKGVFQRWICNAIRLRT